MGDNIERPSTPPQRTLDISALQSTPEHIKQIEINRLKGELSRGRNVNVVSLPLFQT